MEKMEDKNAKIKEELIKRRKVLQEMYINSFTEMEEVLVQMEVLEEMLELVVKEVILVKSRYSLVLR